MTKIKPNEISQRKFPVYSCRIPCFVCWLCVLHVRLKPFSCLENCLCLVYIRTFSLDQVRLLSLSSSSGLQGDTLQGVSTELRCILNSGYYTFVYSASSTPLKSDFGSIQLHYVPHSSLYQNVGEVGVSPSLPTEDRWNEEAIGDFVRKLGFLDSEGEAGSDISHFLHINQVHTCSDISHFLHINQVHTCHINQVHTCIVPVDLLYCVELCEVYFAC